MESERLMEDMVLSPVYLMRGAHYCEFCPPPLYRKNGDSFVPKMVRDGPKGNGEIHVVDKSGVFYIAPTLIAHYINTHHYMPPTEFIDAVKNTGLKDVVDV